VDFNSPSILGSEMRNNWRAFARRFTVSIAGLVAE